ncbi:MAG: thioredoxin [Candidatus Omnitrophica bacterium]|nr:thioredoxin [Candidatus Omnitrophota bacterium]
MVLQLNSDNFEQEVLKSDLPVMVDFWAQWCGPCRMLTPTIDALAKEYAGKIKVCKLNVDDANDIAAKYQVMSIPTILLFHKGKIVNQTVGAVPKEKLEEVIKPYI